MAVPFCYGRRKRRPQSVPVEETIGYRREPIPERRICMRRGNLALQLFLFTRSPASLAACERLYRCREAERLPDQSPTRGNARPLFAVTTLFLLAAALWVALIRTYGTADREILASLFALQPAIEGRLSGDLQGPALNLSVPRELPVLRVRGEQLRIMRGSMAIEQRAAAMPDAATLHALALLRLAQGRLDEAILTLE